MLVMTLMSWRCAEWFMNLEAPTAAPSAEAIDKELLGRMLVADLSHHGTVFMQNHDFEHVKTENKTEEIVHDTPVPAVPIRLAELVNSSVSPTHWGFPQTGVSATEISPEYWGFTHILGLHPNARTSPKC